MSSACIVFVEGLPGAGKTSAAVALGHQLGATVYLENRGENPLHVVHPGYDVAAFEGAAAMEPAEFAGESLTRYRAFADSAADGLHIFESDPYQSGARVLLQLDAPADLILTYMREVEEAVAALRPRMIFLVNHNVLGIEAVRGGEWMNTVAAFIENTRWARNRQLHGREAVTAFIGAYEDLLDALLQVSRLSTLQVAGGAGFGEATVAAASRWLDLSSTAPAH